MTLSPWLLVAVGCAPSLPEPTLEGVAPTWGWQGETTDVTLVGTNLLPSIYAYADTRDDHRIYADFQAELVGEDGLVIPLSGEDLDTYRALSAQVPAGHPVGFYDVRLTTPNGAIAVLEDGFSITATRADHLDFQVDDVAFQVHQTAVFGILLVDPDGLAVGEDLAVQVRADPDQGADGAVFDLVGLDNMSALTDGVGVQGRLGPDGEATLTVTSAVPGGLRLSVEPQAEESLIRGDEVFFDFAPGPVNAVEITLPNDDFSAVAGQAFPVTLSVLDEFGNPVDDQGTELVVEELCGTTREPVTVVGTAELQLAVTGATDDTCPENRLSVSGGASGESEPFATVPGAGQTLRVLPASDTATAGVPFSIFVWSEDAYGNIIQDYTGQITVTDSADSLVSATCEEGSIRYCSLDFELAVSSTIILVADDLGAAGDSDPLAVIAGPASLLTVSPPSDPLIAGAAEELLISVLDSFGNPAVIDPGGLDPFALDDGSGTASLTWQGEGQPGIHTLSCTTTTASEGVVLTVSVPSRGLSVPADPVTVVNDVLATVTGSASPDTVEAGEVFEIDLAGTDAWGNAYTTQVDPVVDLADAALSVSPPTLTLGPDGTATGSFSVSVAGAPVALSISQSGVLLGSVELTVEHGELDHLQAETDADWVWVGDPLLVTVTARDAYENAVTDFSGGAILTSTGSGFLATPLGGFVDGSASTSVSWDAGMLQDAVVATADSGPKGTTDPVDALDPACADPPVADLSLDGSDEVVVCQVAGVASVTADFSGSSSTAGVAAYHLDDGLGESQRLTSDSATVTSSTPGRATVGLVVVDADACGAETSALWWNGDADGEPVGPIELTSSHTQRTAGSATNGIATVQVLARTCSGDLAAAGTVLARTDLGDLSGLTATGSGLALVLDSTGAGSLSWTQEAENHAGTATLHLGTDNGASHGSTTVAVIGDSARPTLVAVDPAGATTELLDELVIAFNEPMASTTLTATNVSLVGPSGSEGFDSMTLDADGSTLTVGLSDTLDTSTGSWTLTVTSGARDDGGNNRLDGTWSGSSSDFTAAFGDQVDSAISVSSCTPDSTAFTPDGDDGSGAEADGVGLAVEASAEPAWWELQVLDAAGSPVRTFRTAATGTSATLTWDGRGDDGLVVAAGNYTLMASTHDAGDNQSTACESPVTLTQHVSEPQ